VVKGGSKFVGDIWLVAGWVCCYSYVMHASTGVEGYTIGRRYLHGKTRQPLTLRYIGGLPGSDATWLGVEYDDPALGKHSGVYQGGQVFNCREGGGSFIKSVKGALAPGKTFAEAIEGRYGVGEEVSKVILGSSKDGIIVEAPGMDGVQRRLGRLERLREVGLDGEWVCGMGDAHGLKSRLVGELFPRELGLWQV
jgi:hypothetical protein